MDEESKGEGKIVLTWTLTGVGLYGTTNLAHKAARVQFSTRGVLSGSSCTIQIGR